MMFSEKVVLGFCTVMAVMSFFCVAWLLRGSSDSVSVESADRWAKIQSEYQKCVYQKGVNDALQTIALLDLEQKLEGKRRTWGEMSEIVRKRLSVEKSQ